MYCAEPKINSFLHYSQIPLDSIKGCVWYYMLEISTDDYIVSKPLEKSLFIVKQRATRRTQSLIFLHFILLILLRQNPEMEREVTW